MSFTTIQKPSKAILIDAANSNELRVAIIDNTHKKYNNILTDLHIEDKKRELYKSNIYKGKISSIEPSLNAVFVLYDDGKRHGFLPFKEIDPTYYEAKLSSLTPEKTDDKESSDQKKEKTESSSNAEPLDESPSESTTDATANATTFTVEEQTSKPSHPQNDQIAKALTIGQEVLVQVVKEERGTKGAALTTMISLAGSYLVLMPNSPSVKGISRRIEGSARDEAKDITSNLKCPDDMGFIIRTAGINQNIAHLQWDLDVLINLWSAIHAEINNHAAPVLMHQESDIISCAVRDHLRQDITDLVVNEVSAFEKIKAYIKQIKPQFVDHVHLYDHSSPLFAHFNIENQIEQAHQREVRLPSGGAIIIDPTEALISVDVNSARAKGSDIEDTAFNTNLEAAQELAKQLRLRDIGGLIVIDFIDMGHSKHQREVESHLKKCLQEDRARIRIGKISSFGLLEMSRQRLRSSLGEVTKIECPRCSGQGMIQSIESLSLSLIRRIREDVMNEQLLQLQLHVPLEVSAQLMNHHRNQISDIETCGKTSILVVPNPNYQSPQFKIKKIRFSDKATKAAQMESKSYQLIEPHRNQYQHEMAQSKQSQAQRAEPIVNAQSITDAHQKKSPPMSLVKRLWDGIFNHQPIKVKSEIDMTTTVNDNIGNVKPKSSPQKRGRTNHNQSKDTKRGHPSRGRKRSQPHQSKHAVKSTTPSDTTNAQAKSPRTTQKKNERQPSNPSEKEVNSTQTKLTSEKTKPTSEKTKQARSKKPTFNETSKESTNKASNKSENKEKNPKEQ